MFGLKMVKTQDGLHRGELPRLSLEHDLPAGGLALSGQTRTQVLESIRHHHRWEMLRSYLLIFLMIILAIYSIHRIGELEAQA